MQSNTTYISKKFYDDELCALGFHRCGLFTLRESDTLEKQGHRLKQLMDGIVTPESESEQHFIDVCHERVEAKTDLEKLWLRYLSAKRAQRVHIIESAKRQLSHYGGCYSTVAALRSNFDGDSLQ